MTVSLMNNLATLYPMTNRFEAAIELRENLRNIQSKLHGTNAPEAVQATIQLAELYFVTDRQNEALALATQLYELQPRDPASFIRLAAWEAWLGRDADYESLRQRLLEQAQGTSEPKEADCAAKAYCYRPSNDTNLLAKAVQLAHRAVELGESGKDSDTLPWFKFAVGLSEYRRGNYSLAEEGLKAAEAAAGTNTDYIETRGLTGLFRAMTLAHQRRLDEARTLFGQVQSEMPPPPRDEHRPLANGRIPDHDILFYWMACKEAEALMGQSVSSKQ